MKSICRLVIVSLLMITTSLAHAGKFNTDLMQAIPLPSFSQASPIADSQEEADFRLTAAVGTKEAWQAFLALHGSKKSNFYVQLAIAALNKITGGKASVPAPKHKTLATKSKKKSNPIFPKSVGTCTHVDVILNLVAHTLNRRHEIKGFPAKNYGTLSAYLKIRYAKPGQKTVITMMDSLIKTTPRKKALGAMDLAFAYLAHNVGLDAAAKYFPARKLNNPMDLGYSSLRQRLLSGLSAHHISWLKNNPKTLKIFPYRATSVIYDQPDAIKLKIARHMETNNLNVTALFILLSMSQHKDLAEFRIHQNKNKKLERYWTNMTMYGSGFTALYDTGWPEMPETTKERNAFYQKFYILTRAAVLEGNTSFFVALFNQTGEIDSITEIAREFIAEIERGDIDPQRDPETARLSIYHIMIANHGREKTDKWLDSITLRGKLSILKMIQFSSATQALQPFLKHLAPLPSKRPADIGSELHWDQWLALAKLIDKGGTLPTTAAVDTIVAELLYQGEKYEQLLSYLNSLPPTNAVPIAEDIAQRLDLRCSAYTFFPGRGFLLAGLPLFRFNE